MLTLTGNGPSSLALYFEAMLPKGFAHNFTTYKNLFLGILFFALICVGYFFIFGHVDVAVADVVLETAKSGANLDEYRDILSQFESGTLKYGAG